MAAERPNANRIDQKLRDDFRRRLQDYGIVAEAADPVLAVLFRTFAVQIENLYNETDQVRTAFLDELITGLGIEPRVARPAQSVVRFRSPHVSRRIPAGTQLLGEADSGEKLVFATDVPVRVSPARLAFALAYQKETLQLLPGVDLPEELQSAGPYSDPVPAVLGPHPALFLGFDNLTADHLSLHSMFFEMSPYSMSLQKGLRSATWCLAADGDGFGASGLLRPKRDNAGVYSLRWLLGGKPQTANAADQSPSLPDGFYAVRVFVLPEMPVEQHFVTVVPRGLESPLRRIMAPAFPVHFSQPRAWIRISLPPDIEELTTAVHGIKLHAVSASNVDCLNQTISFADHGYSIPVGRQTSPKTFLVGLRSVVSEQNEDYAPVFDPSALQGAGRYNIQNGRVILEPAHNADGKPQQRATLRLWGTNGTLGNRVGPNKILTSVTPLPSPDIRITNVTAAAGGADGETLQQARERFEQALLSRDRVVSRADLVSAVRTFDRRILDATIASCLRRTTQGLRRVQSVRIALRREEFVAPDVESRVLCEDLLSYLQPRVLSDLELEVRSEWM